MVWRKDDPPFNFGKPLESVLERRLYRLSILEKKRPGKFTEQLLEARQKWIKEFEYNINIDLAL